MKSKARTARKNHTCSWCGRIIKSGERYEATTCFPNQEPYVDDVPCTVGYCKECSFINLEEK